MTRDMKILQEKLAYLRQNEDYSILYSRDPLRNKKGHVLVGGIMTSDRDGKLIAFSRQLGTKYLNTTWRHQYRLGPCLTETEITDYESQFNITLPDDYRQFLLEVGNGGAGPHYGIYKLGERSVETISEYYEMHTFLEAVFNNTDPVIPEAEITTLSGSFTKFLPIADVGCTFQEVLIIDGIERGNIWDGDFGGGPSLLPVHKYFWSDERPENYSPQTLSFYEWYNDWLDKQILDLHERIMAIG